MNWWVPAPSQPGSRNKAQSTNELVGPGALAGTTFNAAPILRAAAALGRCALPFGS